MLSFDSGFVERKKLKEFVFYASRFIYRQVPLSFSSLCTVRFTVVEVSIWIPNA